MNIDEGYCRWALYHPPLWRCHSTDAKQAKSDRGAPYIYWGYSRWAVGLSIHHCGVLSQHGSKAGSNGRSVNCSSCVHAWPESSGTAAEDCRREGCIRHRLTLAHQDRPKPHASRARLPEGVGLLWANPRGKSYDNSHQGHRGWALSSTFVALSQHGSKAGSNDRSVNGNNFCAHMARAVEQRPRIAAARGVSDTVSHPTRFFSRPSLKPAPFERRQVKNANRGYGMAGPSAVTARQQLNDSKQSGCGKQRTAILLKKLLHHLLRNWQGSKLAIEVIPAHETSKGGSNVFSSRRPAVAYTPVKLQSSKKWFTFQATGPKFC